MVVSDLKITVPGQSSVGRERGCGAALGSARPSSAFPAPQPFPGRTGAKTLATSSHLFTCVTWQLHRESCSPAEAWLDGTELQEPVFGGNSQPAPHPRDNTWIYFLFIPNPTKPQILCSLECIKHPTMFFLTFRGNFQGLPLFPSPLALPVLLWGQVPLLLAPSSLQYSVPQQLLLCVILTMVYKNMSPEEQDCPQAAAGAVDSALCCVRGSCLSSPGHLERADTLCMDSHQGVLAMSLPDWQFSV